MRHKAHELWLNRVLVLCWEFPKHNIHFSHSENNFFLIFCVKYIVGHPFCKRTIIAIYRVMNILFIVYSVQTLNVCVVKNFFDNKQVVVLCFLFYFRVKFLFIIARDRAPNICFSRNQLSFYNESDMCATVFYRLISYYNPF